MSGQYKLSKAGKIWILLAGGKFVAIPLEIQQDGTLELHDNFLTTEKGDVYHICDTDGNISLVKIPTAIVAESPTGSLKPAVDNNTHRETDAKSRTTDSNVEKTIVKERVAITKTAVKESVSDHGNGNDTTRREVNFDFYHRKYDSTNALIEDEGQSNASGDRQTDLNKITEAKAGTAKRVGNLHIFFEGESLNSDDETQDKTNESKDKSKNDRVARCDNSASIDKTHAQTVSTTKKTKISYTGFAETRAVTEDDVNCYGQLSGRRKADGCDGAVHQGVSTVDAVSNDGKEGIASSEVVTGMSMRSAMTASSECTSREVRIGLVKIHAQLGAMTELLGDCLMYLWDRKQLREVQMMDHPILSQVGDVVRQQWAKHRASKEKYRTFSTHGGDLGISLIIHVPSKEGQSGLENGFREGLMWADTQQKQSVVVPFNVNHPFLFYKERLASCLLSAVNKVVASLVHVNDISIVVEEESGVFPKLCDHFNTYKGGNQMQTDASDVAGSSAQQTVSIQNSNHINTEIPKDKRQHEYICRQNDVENWYHEQGYWLRYCLIKGIPEGYSQAQLDAIVKGHVMGSAEMVVCEKLREAVVICKTSTDAEALSKAAGAPFNIKHITLPLVCLQQTIKQEVMHALEKDLDSVKVDLNRINVLFKTGERNTIHAPTRCQLECAKNILEHYSHTSDVFGKTEKAYNIDRKPEAYGKDRGVGVDDQNDGKRKMSEHLNSFQLLMKASDLVWDVVNSLYESVVQELRLKQRNISYYEGCIMLECEGREYDKELAVLVEILKLSVKMLDEKQMEEVPVLDNQRAVENCRDIEEALQMQCCVFIPSRNAIVAFCDSYEDMQKIKHRLKILEGMIKVTVRGRRWFEGDDNVEEIRRQKDSHQASNPKGRLGNDENVSPKKTHSDKQKQVKFSAGTDTSNSGKYGPVYESPKNIRESAVIPLLEEIAVELQNAQAQNVQSVSQTKAVGWNGDEKMVKGYRTKDGLMIYVYVADILKAPVQCIVNPSNSQLVHGGGLARLISQAAGPALKQDCDWLIKKYKKIPIAEVCMTTAGRLPFKAVLHAVGPVWSDYSPHGQADVDRCHRCLGLTVLRTMLDAEKYGCKSVAIPALSSAVHGVPVDVCVASYVRAVLEYSRKAPADTRVTEVHFIDIKESMVRHIQAGFDEVKQGRMPGYSYQNFVRGTKTSRSWRCKSAEKFERTGFKDRASVVGRSAEWPLSDSGRQKNNGSNAYTGFLPAREKCKDVFPPSPRRQTDNKQGSSSAVDKAARRGSFVDRCPICLDRIKDLKSIVCGHMFCKDCIDKAFSYRKMCPVCGMVCGIITGNQPQGTMHVAHKQTSLEGHSKCGTLVITYIFPGGSQGPEHPQPGTPYMGINRTAYLPDDVTGRKILSLLRLAFDRRLVFTIGRSQTTGKDGVITWNDITHKTTTKPFSEYGYPDLQYFGRVIQELATVGVTEKDLYLSAANANTYQRKA